MRLLAACIAVFLLSPAAMAGTERCSEPYAPVIPDGASASAALRIWRRVRGERSWGGTRRRPGIQSLSGKASGVRCVLNSTTIFPLVTRVDDFMILVSQVLRMWRVSRQEDMNSCHEPRSEC